ncbi:MULTISPECIES: dihydrolipoyl dehydrogenase family protein [unclassified Solwaraspora]|uniref:dihydrolipoyl dehydrogenase family protein n=1 Tax=unclassified Solwaraspora TaxID=2627926 RepID=UPI00259B7D16|nr:NAD(P)/FAD-dependent oxidoreductase [Solwaraspora sp. WMMA2056]WJK41857.1 NAD(P)/FAD-dependent oxidoreductase [Solwaraspora sp. WMMA2056]
MREPEQVDVVVVGLGVGGEEVAGRLGQAGLTVVGVERRLVGGECPYWGCVPSKMMIRAANALAEGRRIDGLAGTASVRPDWTPVARRIRDEATADWTDTAAVDRLTTKGVRVLHGTARLTGPGRVDVDGQSFTARRGVVLATGTVAVVPPIDGLAGTPYWTNKEAIEVTELPESLVVLGGGAIGLELAQVFARFGVRVTIVEAGERLLSREEPESSALAARVLGDDGVRIRLGSRAEWIEHRDDTFAVHLSQGGPESGQRLLVATGRRSDLGDLGLDTVGLDPAARHLPVDERMRVGDGMWAVGDVAGHGAFTHLAMYQADVAVRDILDQGGPAAEYRAVPRVTFTDPEIGAVGLTEQQAREQGIDVRTAITDVADSSRGWIHGPGNDGFVKLVADADRGVLVGATSAGPTGGEVLGALAVAVHGEVPLTSLRHMIYAYPTVHRAIQTAVAQLT